MNNPWDCTDNNQMNNDKNNISHGMEFSDSDTFKPGSAITSCIRKFKSMKPRLTVLRTKK